MITSDGAYASIKLPIKFPQKNYGLYAMPIENSHYLVVGYTNPGNESYALRVYDPFFNHESNDRLEFRVITIGI